MLIQAEINRENYITKKKINIRNKNKNTEDEDEEYYNFCYIQEIIDAKIIF